MQNIEFKAELRDIEAARQQCRLIGAKRIGILKQTDSYYRLTDGRLKRRVAEGEPIEWIFYHRPDAVKPRMSNFTILTEEQARRRWGTHTLHHWLDVVKTRELWMIEQMRIHLDQVEQLGTFIEFEAAVDRRNSAEDGRALVEHARLAFGPILGEPIAASYSDLLAQKLELSDAERA